MTDVCTARPTCGREVAPTELTCPVCLSHARNDLAQIVALAALMPTEAQHAGINSEAAYLAGPAADPATWTARKVYTARTLGVALGSLEDDDPWHPYGVLGRWQMMLEEDYGLRDTRKITTATAAAFLDRILHRLANDPAQDFALFAREIRECRTHLEAVLHNSRTPDLGAPCPECEAPAKRLRKEWSHWCLDEDCRNPVHDPVGKHDRWVCPTDPDHWWSDEDYRKRVADVYLDNASALTLSEMERRTGIPGRTLRHWAYHGTIKPCGKRHDGKAMYAVTDVEALRSGTIAN